MPRFPGRSAARRAGRMHRPACEPLEERSLLSLSILQALLPTPPPQNPVLVPIQVSNQLPKNVSGRIEGLYELSLTRHPLYQSISKSHVLKAPMYYPDYTGTKAADLDVIAADARINPQHAVEFTGKVLLPIDVTQPALTRFWSIEVAPPARGPSRDGPRSPLTRSSR